MDDNNEELNQLASESGQSSHQLARDAARLAKDKLKSKAKFAIRKALLPVLLVILKIVLIVIVIALILNTAEWVIELFQAKEAPEMFINEFIKQQELENADENDEAQEENSENESDSINNKKDKMIRSLVNIVPDFGEDTYHLELKQDAEAMILKAAEKVGKKYSNLQDPELWKKFLIADIATHFPNLGGSGQSIISGLGYSNGSGFWWPIGSSETTTRGGKTFASGDPEIPLGSNVVRGGTSKGWSNVGHPKTTGEALDISGNNQIGHYNVISMAKGVVERADDGYPNNGPNQDNGGMGNCVYVRYPNNILIRYMHLAQGTVAVHVGDEVDYGQVLGKMGHSGESYGPHLHVDMWIGPANGSGGQDIAAYMDSTNPRPSRVNTNVSNLDGFLFIGDSITVRLGQYGGLSGRNIKYAATVSSTPEQWLNNSRTSNGEATYSKLPANSDSIKGICIMLGTNGINQATQMTELIEKIHNKYPEKPIYVQKILPLTRIGQDVSAYNTYVQNFCLGTNYAIFIDATEDVELDDDGIHPSIDRGCRQLANNIENAITNGTRQSNIEEYIDSVFSTAENMEQEENREDDVYSTEIDTRKFQGTIKIKRITPNKNPGELAQNVGMKTIEMKYVEPDTFETYVLTGNKKALEVFTLSEDYSELITASWNYDSGFEITKNNIDYRNLTEPYAMPFEYPMMFQVTGKDKEFITKLTNLVLGSSVDIAIVDNVTTFKIDTETTLYNGIDVYEGPTVSTQIKENVYTDVELATINSWWSKRQTTFNQNFSFDESSVDGGIVDSYVDDEGRSIAVHQVVRTSNASYNIDISNTELESNHEGFVKIFKYSKARANTQPSWIFRFLEENENTANMIELTKYLFYMTSGVDYGVTDFNDIHFGTFTDISGSTEDILFDFIASWENGPLMSYLKGNASYNSTPYIYRCITEDKRYYLCVEDIGMNNGTRNFGFGVCHYYSGRWNNVEYYRDEGVDITQYYQEGSRLEVEKVDNVKKRIIQDMKSNIMDTVQGLDLNDQQIDALVAVKYQYGNIGNFVEAYRRYGNTDALKNNLVVNGRRPWVNGMGETNGRPQANWKLFHEGKYVSGLGEELLPSNYAASEIQQSGQGYDRVYRSSSGKTYKLFIQNRYANVPYWNSNVANCGCGPSSAAIILSGYGKNDTPQTVARSYAANGRWGADGECKFFTDRGLRAVNESPNWDKAIRHLKNGDPMVASITSTINLNGAVYTGHFLTFLDINAAGDKIYIGDPGWNGLGCGWQRISYLKNSGAFGQFFYVNQ